MAGFQTGGVKVEYMNVTLKVTCEFFQIVIYTYHIKIFHQGKILRHDFTLV